MLHRETPTDDNQRTGRLLDHADRAFDRDDAYTLGDGFEHVIQTGLGADKTTSPYPPTGHDYPRYER